jgi:hypothetical protein
MLTPETARAMLALKPEEQAVRRIDELADRSANGTLTAEERAEYQVFVELGDLVALLQAKARHYLSDRPG